MTTGSGTIAFVYPVSGLPVSGISPESTVVIRAIRSDETLDEFPVQVKLNSELAPGDEQRGLADTILPVRAETQALDLVIAGQVADSFRIAARRPRSARFSPSSHRTGNSGWGLIRSRAGRRAQLRRPDQFRQWSDVADSRNRIEGQGVHSRPQSVPRRPRDPDPYHNQQRYIRERGDQRPLPHLESERELSVATHGISARNADRQDQHGYSAGWLSCRPHAVPGAAEPDKYTAGSGS